MQEKERKGRSAPISFGRERQTTVELRLFNFRLVLPAFLPSSELSGKSPAIDEPPKNSTGRAPSAHPLLRRLRLFAATRPARLPWSFNAHLKR